MHSTPILARAVQIESEDKTSQELTRAIKVPLTQGSQPRETTLNAALAGLLGYTAQRREDQIAFAGAFETQVRRPLEQAQQSVRAESSDFKVEATKAIKAAAKAEERLRRCRAAVAQAEIDVEAARAAHWADLQLAALEGIDGGPGSPGGVAPDSAAAAAVAAAKEKDQRRMSSWRGALGVSSSSRKSTKSPDLAAAPGASSPGGAPSSFGGSLSTGGGSAGAPPEVEGGRALFVATRFDDKLHKAKAEVVLAKKDLMQCLTARDK